MEWKTWEFSKLGNENFPRKFYNFSYSYDWKLKIKIFRWKLTWTSCVRPPGSQLHPPILQSVFQPIHSRKLGLPMGTFFIVTLLHWCVSRKITINNSMSSSTTKKWQIMVDLYHIEKSHRKCVKNMWKILRNFRSYAKNTHIFQGEVAFFHVNSLPNFPSVHSVNFHLYFPKFRWNFSPQLDVEILAQKSIHCLDCFLMNIPGNFRSTSFRSDQC